MAEYNIHFENELIALFPKEIYERLRAKFSVVALDQGQVIIEANSEMDQLYFPAARTLCSVIASTQDGNSVEIGMIASEGVVSASTCLGARRSPHQVFIQVAGKAMRIRTDDLLPEFEADPAMRKLMLTYSHRFYTAVAQTALCNRVHTLHQRLCRWLLMTQDRVQRIALPLTQEFLSKLLGANRATVSEACTALQNHGMISYRRGEITVVDRVALEKSTCECYSFLLQHFKRPD